MDTINQLKILNHIHWAAHRVAVDTNFKTLKYKTIELGSRDNWAILTDKLAVFYILKKLWAKLRLTLQYCASTKHFLSNIAYF